MPITIASIRFESRIQNDAIGHQVWKESENTPTNMVYKSPNPITAPIRKMGDVGKVMAHARKAEECRMMNSISIISSSRDSIWSPKVYGATHEIAKNPARPKSGIAAIKWAHGTARTADAAEAAIAFAAI